MLAPLCLAQTGAQAPAPPTQAAPPVSGSQKAAPEASEQKISPQEAEELFRSVDEILKFSSQDSGLPIKHEVKRHLTSREEVVSYLQKQMSEDKDAKRLQRSALVLKKFGLIPDDFDLSSFLVTLLREQVAGYYDYKTKTVNLLDWVGVEQQKPVLAHELTHALQDQSFGLEKWMKAGDVDLDNIKQPTWDDIQKDEVSSARQAVVEGSAMVVLVDYMLAPFHQSLLTSPQMVKTLKEGMLVGTDQSPQFQNAPIFLKEALTFPYRYGIDFISQLLSSGGKEKAFAGAFENPPNSTRQIMEPKTYLSGEKIPPMSLPDFATDFKDYKRFDVGAMGEFDVAVLVDQYAGVDASREIYPEWRGGYYYAVQPKGDPSGPLGLMYASRWSSADSAEQFAAIYAESLKTRYRHVHEAVDSGAATKVDLDSEEKLTGKHIWLTEQGVVMIEVRGDTVLVTESLDQDVTDKLERDVFPASFAEKGITSPERTTAELVH
jgi:hypothetical protein